MPSALEGVEVGGVGERGGTLAADGAVGADAEGGGAQVGNLLHEDDGPHVDQCSITEVT